jgi:hypothetical protein
MDQDIEDEDMDQDEAEEAGEGRKKVIIWGIYF